MLHVKWVLCHQDMACPQIVDGGVSLNMWGEGVAANILNNQPQTANKVWSSSLWVGHGANNCSL
jgi:hypothetical protein